MCILFDFKLGEEGDEPSLQNRLSVPGDFASRFRNDSTSSTGSTDFDGIGRARLHSGPEVVVMRATVSSSSSNRRKGCGPKRLVVINPNPSLPNSPPLSDVVGDGSENHVLDLSTATPAIITTQPSTD